MTKEQIGTRSNLVRGRSQNSIELIEAMYEIAESCCM